MTIDSALRTYARGPARFIEVRDTAGQEVDMHPLEPRKKIVADGAGQPEKAIFLSPSLPLTFSDGVGVMLPHRLKLALASITAYTSPPAYPVETLLPP